MLPYLAKDKDGVGVFDCSTCRDPESRIGYQDVATRAAWHCGWMDREQWTGLALEAGMFDGGMTMDDGSCCDICPGYLARLPQIAEAAEATWALRKQVLPLYHAEPTALLLDAVRVLDQAYSQFEAKSIKENHQ